MVICILRNKIIVTQDFNLFQETSQYKLNSKTELKKIFTAKVSYVYQMYQTQLMNVT